ncbi:hypothetical protein D3C80_671510 [compost metagenome]
MLRGYPAALPHQAIQLGTGCGEQLCQQMRTDKAGGAGEQNGFGVADLSHIIIRVDGDICRQPNIVLQSTYRFAVHRRQCMAAAFIQRLRQTVYRRIFINIAHIDFDSDCVIDGRRQLCCQQ